MLHIKDVFWLSKEACEAQVLISDGKFDLICFAQPFRENKELESDLILYSFDSQHLQKSYSNSFSIQKLSSSFGYGLVGQVIDRANKLIKIGRINIEMDISLPNDLENGDFMSFTCERLDLNIF